MSQTLHTYEYVLQCVAVCCSVLQCVAVCCSVCMRYVTDITHIRISHVSSPCHRHDTHMNESNICAMSQTYNTYERVMCMSHVIWQKHIRKGNVYAPCHRHPTHTEDSCVWAMAYGVATISRLLQIIGVFCKRALWKRLYSAKETYNFKEPTRRSHSIWLKTYK